jgi:hypothetical protein
MMTTALAVACCAPWTARNCVRMERCALVSVNGGWNLLIGTQSRTGGWGEVVVPEPCKTVWAEAKKDDCFGAAARASIASEPWPWLAKVPEKLAATFDYIGASPWYMHTSNAEAFTERDKIAHGAVETLVTRVLLVLALLAGASLEGPRKRARVVVAVMGAVSALTLHAYLGYLGVAATALLLGRRLLCVPVLVSSTAITILATALTHAVFFGAGRYGLVVLPLVAGFGVAAAPFGWPPGARRTPTPPAAIESRRSSMRTGSSSRVSAR